MDNENNNWNWNCNKKKIIINFIKIIQIIFNGNVSKK